MCTPPRDALESLKYVCETNHLFEGRLAHLSTFDRSVVIACMEDIALTGLKKEEFILPMILVDVAISGESCGIRLG